MEEDVFLKKMKGVEPIKNKENNILKETNLKNFKKTEKNKKKIIEINKNIIKKNTNKSKFEISYSDVNKDLKRGKINIDRRLDLHGYSLQDAKERFTNEVVKAYNNNKRCLLVVTGKGINLNKFNHNLEDEDRPKLYYGKIKNSITTWIHEESLQKYILTYQNASVEQGGDGALYVYLRKKKN